MYHVSLQALIYHKRACHYHEILAVSRTGRVDIVRKRSMQVGVHGHLKVARVSMDGAV